MQGRIVYALKTSTWISWRIRAYAIRPYMGCLRIFKKLISMKRITIPFTLLLALQAAQAQIETITQVIEPALL